MVENFKQRLLLTVVFAALLLVSSACAALTPVAHAAEPTAPEKSLVILNDVAGFNMTAYTANLKASERNSFLSLPQEEADFSLTSSQGRLRAKCSFVDNHLRQIFISDLNGSPSLNQPAADAVGNAKDFLERYQGYTGVSFYGELESMLDTVNVGENVTKTEGNVQLKVSVLGQSLLDLMWTYVDENGVPAMFKDVFLSYDHGFLKCFLDNWQLFRIASKPKLSSEEAVAIALNAAKNFSWEAVGTEDGTVTVSDFRIKSVLNTTLSYLNYGEASSARGGDPFALYPSWYVPLGFDKVYPGCVTGLTVGVWADTGEVSEIGPMVFSSAPALPDNKPPEVQGQTSTSLPAFPVVIAFAVGAVGISFGYRRVVFSKLKSTGKSCHSKLCGALLVLLISFCMVVTSTPKANAIPANQNAKSMIYASMYGQEGNEAEAASEVCGYIASCFSDAGYDVTNACGTDTTKSNVLTWASSMEQNYDCVALFHYGHGGYGCYFDNDGDWIYDYEIGDKTVLGKHFFVFLWVCWSAEFGLPAAWTQGFTSYDGYNCVIGFIEASPLLSHWSFKFYSALGVDVICEFYYYALQGSSVFDAMYQVCLDLFSTGYYESPLYNGYLTWWPYNPLFPEMGEGPAYGRMQIDGYTNLCLAKQ